MYTIRKTGKEAKALQGAVGLIKKKENNIHIK
jgi:hypothetical protein